MVGTYWTSEGRYGPFPSRSGTHDGWKDDLPPSGGCHSSSFRLSQPQPRPAVPVNLDGSGLLPRNPSSVAEASTMCPAHDGVSANSNVRSEMTNLRASVARFGIWLGSNCA